jgi:hypothetical protein
VTVGTELHYKLITHTRHAFLQWYTASSTSSHHQPTARKLRSNKAASVSQEPETQTGSPVLDLAMQTRTRICTMQVVSMCIPYGRYSAQCKLQADATNRWMK